MQKSINGRQRGGFLGGTQSLLADFGTALCDTIGGRTVQDLSSKSGDAAGRRDYLVATVYGLLTINETGEEALTWGRLGTLKGALKGVRSKGTEFSHWIPNRFGGPRQWWNGRVVTIVEHAKTDDWRHRTMRKLWKAENGGPWPVWRPQLNRLPEWSKFVLLSPLNEYKNRKYRK